MGIILQDLNNKSQAELLEIIANMRKSASSKLTLKVSEKGALSVYGMGRWPITLYRAQWERLFANREAVEAFIAANADRLATKPD
jgi:hypothetical protein